MKKYVLFICLLSIHFMLVLSGCTLFVKPPLIPKLEALSVKEVDKHEWLDDLHFEGLEPAVNQSIRYYRQLSSANSFQYNDYIYSPEEMAASHELFLETVSVYQGRERLRQLRKKFLFFESKNSDGEAFFTGYYEPVLDGSLVPTRQFSEPVYETPVDLIEVDLSRFAEKWNNEKIVGRLEGERLIPYDSREEIVYKKSLNGRANPIAYVNEIELFFLQIQGSGRIKLPSGTLKRVNYAQKNGHPYVPIGRVLKDKIPPEEMSLQSIKAYLYAHPDEVPEILNHNQSYIFFREVEEGPLGDIGVSLTPGRSIAMDKRVVPRGGLAFVETSVPVFKDEIIVDWKPLKLFVLVQDTGGAIRGHGRADIFFGHDKNAELTAGHLKQTGRLFLIVARKEFLSQ